MSHSLPGGLEFIRVSAAFPLKRVYLYTFDWPRFITGAKPDEKKGSVRVISDGKYLQDRHEIVNSMRAIEQYIVEVPTVDLLGNMKAKVMVVIMVQAVRPAHAILTLHAEWLQLVIAFTQGQIMGFAADKDFDGMRIAIMQPAFSTHVMKDEKMHELERKTGVKIIQVYSVLFDLADASPAEMAAVSAKNVATLEADADVERGRGKGELAKGQIVGRRQVSVRLEIPSAITMRRVPMLLALTCSKRELPGSMVMYCR